MKKDKKKGHWAFKMAQWCKRFNVDVDEEETDTGEEDVEEEGVEIETDKVDSGGSLEGFRQYLVESNTPT